MKVLIVEDDVLFVGDLVASLKRVGCDSVHTVRSRDEAFKALSEDHFDILVLDLQIPTTANSLDAAPEHGQLVYTHSLSVAPGMPVFILTGSSTDHFVPHLIKTAKQVDLWGSRQEFSTVDVERKDRMDKFVSRMESIAGEVRILAGIDINVGAKRVVLSRDEARLVRIFARQWGGQSVDITPLGGGRSGSKTLRATIKDASGIVQMRALAKLGARLKIEIECQRYDKSVPKLEGAAFPAKISQLSYGAKSLHGVFYKLAHDFEQSAFEVCGESRASSTLAGEAAKLCQPWHQAQTRSTVPIGDIRRRLIADDAALDIAKKHSLLDQITALEKRTIQCSTATIHGDLHGGNILVRGKVQPVLIDFGDVGPGPAALDPVSLELSLVFHPDSPLREQTWPTLQQAERWPDVELFAVNSAAADFIIGCRRWAHDVAAGDKEVFACAYAYCFRHLKFESARTDLALAIIKSVVAELSS